MSDQPKVDWMTEALQLAAQCWCDDETSNILMDGNLAQAFARRLAPYMEMAAQQARNAEFYRGIVTQIGELFGAAAKTSDDGSLQDTVLALKVPELVARQRDSLDERTLQHRVQLQNALTWLREREEAREVARQICNDAFAPFNPDNARWVMWRRAYPWLSDEGQASEMMQQRIANLIALAYCLIRGEDVPPELSPLAKEVLASCDPFHAARLERQEGANK